MVFVLKFARQYTCLMEGGHDAGTLGENDGSAMRLAKTTTGVVTAESPYGVCRVMVSHTTMPKLNRSLALLGAPPAKTSGAL